MSGNGNKTQSDKAGSDGDLMSPQTSQLEEKGQRVPVDNTDEDEEFSYAEQRQIVHRIDRRLLVILGLMYCVSLIDRGNMPNAAIAGMHDDLETDVGYRYVSSKQSFWGSLVQDSNSILVHRHSRLLHYIHHISASGHGGHSQVGS